MVWSDAVASSWEVWTGVCAGYSNSRAVWNLRHWSEGDLGLWAVSDAAPEVLARFGRSLRAATGG